MRLVRPVERLPVITFLVFTFTIITIPATRCDPADLPTFSNTDLVIHGRMYSDTATYACPVGRHFSDDVYAVTVTCELSETWETVPSNGCVRKCYLPNPLSAQT
jgi:hypothetical protein